MELKDWKLSKLGENIWKGKYQYDDESFDEWLNRVSNGDENIKQLIIDKKFLFGGRILANRGLNQLGKKVTYSNCFKEGSKVITQRGLINIEDVVIGDKVMTEDGSWQNVNNVMCRDYTGDIYKVSGSSLYGDIYCTPNHQFLTQDGWVRADRLLWKKSHRLKTPNLIFEKTYDTIDLYNVIERDEQTEIREINNKIKLFRKCNKNRHNKSVNWTSFGHEVNRYIQLTPEFRYFIGRWLGDGSITRRRGKTSHSILQIVFNKEKEKEDALLCKKIGDEVFGFECVYRETEQNIISLRWENEIISTWFYKEFGEKCNGKHLNEKYVGDLEIAKGLFDSDGSLDTHGRGNLLLKNIQLIKWFRDTMYLNGFNTLKIRKINEHEDTYSVGFSTGTASKGFASSLRKTYHDGRKNLVTNNDLYKEYVKIDQIEILQDQECKVYNLSVENVHSYTVNGVVVHNCYVLPEVEDSIESIYKTCSDLARTFSYGGGVGIDISKLRPKGSKVNNSAETTTGAVSFMNTFSEVTSTICQNGRRGALMLSMDCSHPDIEEFIDIKTDLEKVTKANISVKVTDEFMNAVVNDLDWELYFKTEHGDEIKKTIKAKYLFNKLCENNWNYAEPGLINISRIDNYNILSEDEEFKYAGVNPLAN